MRAARPVRRAGPGRRTSRKAGTAPRFDPYTAVALQKGNVYWELSGWAPRYFPDSLERDVRGRLQDKVMFGSDYPSIPNERLLREWEEIGHSDEIMEKVFFRNAERTLGLLSQPKRRTVNG